MAGMVQLLVVIIFFVLNRHRINPDNAAHNLEIIGAEQPNEDEKPDISIFTYIIPIVPVLMNMIFKWDAIPSLTLATILAMLMTGKMKGYKQFVEFLNKTIQQSVSDIAGLIMFLMALIMFSGAATAAVLSGTGLFNEAFLIPLLYAPAILAVSTDITQSWNVWGLNYMKVQSKDFLKYGVPVMWIITIINELLVYYFFG